MPESLLRNVCGRSWKMIQALIVIVLATSTLVACGDHEGDKTGLIDWHTGTPPGFVSAIHVPTATPEIVVSPTPTIAPSPTAIPTPPVADQPTITTPEQRKLLQPNELGQIPILEYHNFTTDRAQEAQFTRVYEDFYGDLQWLYDHNFYVVPLHEVFENRISAPAGKHPVALTFDDSTSGQFRLLPRDDGSYQIDPHSAVGIMESFFRAHPDFGRGGFFAVLPSSCFNWQGGEVEADQTPLCEQKLRWLLANGYEVSSHTLTHQSLKNIDDEAFKREVGGGIQALQQMVPEITGDILALPDGRYPGNGKNVSQMNMIKHGFNYNGQHFQLIGCLKVGADPANSPASVNWDPIETPRIQAFNDQSVWGSSAFWFAAFESNPERLYTSDGDPETITIPDVLPEMFEGTLDEQKVKTDGLQVIRYIITTGVAE